jgi:integrase
VATFFNCDADVKAIAKPGKTHDGDGLWLDVRSATSASWLFKFTAPGGKVDEVGLGSRKKITLERARELKGWCIEQLGNGANPKELLQAAKAEAIALSNAPKPKTVYELARDHVTLIAKKVKTDTGRKAFVRSMHADSIGDIADMAPGDVTKEAVKALMVLFYTGHNAKGELVRAPRPVQADDVRQRLCKLLKWARGTGRITTPDWQNPAAWEGNLEHEVNRDLHVPVNHPALPFAEVGQFLADVRAQDRGTRGVKLGLEWLVISGSRVGEVTGCDWREIDWVNDCWSIPDHRMKMRRRHRVPLTARHHEILNELKGGPDQEAPASGLMFVAHSDTGTNKQTLRDVQLKVRKGITLHGFRSSFSTWARSETYKVELPGTGETRRIRLYDEAMIEEALAHVVGGDTRNAYVRDDFLEVRRPMMESWAAYCGVVQSNVVQMRRRRAA